MLNDVLCPPGLIAAVCSLALNTVVCGVHHIPKYSSTPRSSDCMVSTIPTSLFAVLRSLARIAVCPFVFIAVLYAPALVAVMGLTRAMIATVCLPAHVCQ